METMETKSLKDSKIYKEKFGKKDRVSFLYIFLVIIFVALIGSRVYLANNYFCVTVVGNSMCPTLEDGEVLLVKKGNDAKRGDIIIVDVTSYKEGPKSELVINPFADDTDFLIKRLIAIEGDTVCCKNGDLLIRYAGKEYGKNEWDFHPSDMYIKDGKNDNFGEYVVGEGEIFFLGDNRLISQDSRYKDEDKPHLNQLYKMEDICGVVPSWAYENRDWLQYMPGIYDSKR